jgi:hypothetical protein
MDDSFIITISILAAIGLFFALRAVFLWYYKINEIVKNQQATNTLLRKMFNHQTTGKVYGDIDGELIVEDTLTGKIRGITKEKYESLPRHRQQLLIILKK